jgi:hypothetical protein
MQQWSRQKSKVNYARMEGGAACAQDNELMLMV